MESMKKYKTFEAWKAVHIRSGDGEKYRAQWDAIHGVEAPKPRRRRRTKAEMEADEQKSTDE